MRSDGVADPDRRPQCDCQQVRYKHLRYVEKMSHHLKPEPTTSCAHIKQATSLPQLRRVYSWQQVPDSRRSASLPRLLQVCIVRADHRRRSGPERNPSSINRSRRRAAGTGGMRRLPGHRLPLPAAQRLARVRILNLTVWSGMNVLFASYFSGSLAMALMTVSLADILAPVEG